MADNRWKKAGLGVASVLSSAIYSPIKVQYALVGAFTGGVAWDVSGGKTELAQKIWEPSLGGNYLVAPRVLRGSKSSRSL